MRRRLRHRRVPLRSEAGQAAIELVALLPFLVLLALVAWQAAVAGQAAWLASGAGRAAARAAAGRAGPAGAPHPEAAARRALTPALARGVRVDAGDDVVVRVAVRSVVGGGRLATIGAR